MLRIVLLVGFTFLASSAELLVGTSSQCIGGRLHTLTHNVTSSVNFVDLDGDLGQDLKGVQCDLDHTRMTLNFKSQAKRDIWWIKFKHFGDHFIVGGTTWNCSAVQSNMGGAVLRRVMPPNLVGPRFFSNSFEIRTTIANYDEVFDDGAVSYTAVSHSSCQQPQVDADHEICLGFNTDCQSGHATQPIPLFTSPETSFVQLSATCTDCYAAFEADMAFTMQFKSFRLHAFELGLKNASIDTSVVMNVAADKQSTLSLDKQLDLVGTQRYLFNFKVGPVPFVAFFDVPIEVIGEFDLNAHADATFGASSKISLGSLDISWDPVNHWQHLTPKLGFQLTPALASTALLDIKANTGLRPSFNLAFDRIFTYNMVATPMLSAEVTASEASEQLCIDSTFAMDITASAELKIDIDMLDFHKDWQWQKTLVSINKEPIPHKCVHI